MTSPEKKEAGKKGKKFHTLRHQISMIFTAVLLLFHRNNYGYQRIFSGKILYFSESRDASSGRGNFE